MTMTPFRTLLLAVFGVTALSAAQAQTVYNTTLSGANEVPPVTTTASGSCTAILNAAETQLDIGCTYSGVDPQEPAPAAGAAHIHNAPTGANGPIVFNLSPGLDETPFGDFAGDIQISWPVTAADVTALQAGNLYVNIHSAANASGEIRGQLAPAAVGTAQSFNFPLSGDQEVPPVATTTSGQCLAVLNETASTLSLDCNHDLITDTPGGHIHLGAAGTNGPIVFSLPNLGASPVMTAWSVAPGDPGHPLTPDLVAELLAGNLYVNLHSAANRSGELRGQIVDVQPPAAPAVSIPTLGQWAMVLLGLVCLALGGSVLRRRAS